LVFLPQSVHYYHRRFKYLANSKNRSQHEIMSATVDKALELFNHFTEARSQIGLSELARLAGADKATVHRMAVVLAKHGFLEQEPNSKLYRLGAGFLRYARNREASFPTSSLVIDILQGLTEQTGETSHASLIAGGSLATIGLVPGPKALHVTLDAGEGLPFHATASGIACMAFLPEAKVGAILKRKLVAYTENTPTTPEVLRKVIAQARLKGFAHSDQSYGSDVYGIAAPVFGTHGAACGAVAVATPSHRITREVKHVTSLAVMEAAVSISRRLGGEPPAAFRALLGKIAA
jgi:IclR family transcriptional regulator, acetate operon repressor